MLEIPPPTNPISCLLLHQNSIATMKFDFLDNLEATISIIKNFILLSSSSYVSLTHKIGEGVSSRARPRALVVNSAHEVNESVSICTLPGDKNF